LQVAADYYNTVFGTSKKSDVYWTVTIPRDLETKFDCQVDVLSELQPIADLDTKLWLFKRVPQITGVHFTSKTVNEFTEDQFYFDSDHPFDVTDLRRYVQKV
jgi:hypothetical protein